MGSAIGSILPEAIGVAISPLPIIAVILMLFSKRARSNGLAFLAGWVLALAVVGGVVLALAGAGKISAGGTPSTAGYAIKLLLACCFSSLRFATGSNVPRKVRRPRCPNGWRRSIPSPPDGPLGCLRCWQA